ncbi:MAG TPA: Rieske 2Fe-2S domain-containing protein [Terricaulis sp.]|nr:Rieske 2Fe-2S domain-containing protein [Terricaulis sp.]
MIAPGATLALLADLPDPGALRVEAGGLSLILTRRGDRVAAFLNRCTHADYPLQHADGRLIVQEGRYLVCAVHGASYALDDGACAGGPCNGRGLTRVAVAVRDGVVVIA